MKEEVLQISKTKLYLSSPLHSKTNKLSPIHIFTHFLGETVVVAIACLSHVKIVVSDSHASCSIYQKLFLSSTHNFSITWWWKKCHYVSFHFQFPRYKENSENKLCCFHYFLCKLLKIVNKEGVIFVIVSVEAYQQKINQTLPFVFNFDTLDNFNKQNKQE